ncbi:ABC transporter permease [Paenirhodobacter populi]|uniref:ABC transporter permease n=1 Tax=Paenirhodobacter populi TaxID=2306993 RepID=A0A443K3S1_9RHOB|nr:ABC transporter permease [Sinirhodobacter populi]RWR05241.1 ABC transporter permease [Sinirhodobacter populi]RWR17476.1 ABC transporter permease [Sinirhodobacter populi]RWR27353.1 ABC transporter permease [Sinirhodobacter populi]
MATSLTLKNIVTKLGQGLFVLWAAFTISFVLLQIMPGDAILVRFMDGDMGLTPDAIASIRTFYGADEPFLVQYFQTIMAYLTGNFGNSVISGMPVAQEIMVNLPRTALLAGLGFTGGVTLALIIAVLATLPGFRWIRNLFQAAPALLASVPVFWLGILLIQIFSFRLGLISVIAPGPWERLILPVATLAVPIAAPIAQILLRNIDAFSVQPFAYVARAKGASQRYVLLRHVARNAVLPVLTIAGVTFGELLAGAVVTETVFGLNGLGRLAERSVRNQDAAVLQAVVLIAAFGYVVVNFIVDMLYPLIDPRLRKPQGGNA